MPFCKITLRLFLPAAVTTSCLTPFIFGLRVQLPTAPATDHTLSSALWERPSRLHSSPPSRQEKLQFLVLCLRKGGMDGSYRLMIHITTLSTQTFFLHVLIQGHLRDMAESAAFVPHSEKYTRGMSLWRSAETHLLSRANGWALGHKTLPPARSFTVVAA